MPNCIGLYITDKSGRKFFKTLCSADCSAPEFRNLSRKLADAAKYPQAYAFLDLESARIEQESLTIGDFK